MCTRCAGRRASTPRTRAFPAARPLHNGGDMAKRILITGGAGFIGSHLADQLLAAGHQVRAYDNLSPQVHGPDGRRPDYLSEAVELIVADVRDAHRLREALVDVDVVFHLAAAVGVGQSMYEVARYIDVNSGG